MKNELITIGNGKTAINFVLEQSNKLAVVDLNVLKRLADLLPKADLFTIKIGLKKELNDVTSIQGYITLLENEVNFHKSVNLITAYPSTDEIKVVGKINLEEKV